MPSFLERNDLREADGDDAIQQRATQAAHLDRHKRHAVLR